MTNERANVMRAVERKLVRMNYNETIDMFGACTVSYIKVKVPYGLELPAFSYGDSETSLNHFTACTGDYVGDITDYILVKQERYK